MKTNRRNFLKVSGLGFAATTIPTFSYALTLKSRMKNSTTESFQLGIATYSLRKFTLEDTLVVCNKLGIKKIALKSFHLPLDSTEEQIKFAIQKCNDAGVEVYAVGAISLLSKDEIDNAFEYARKVGVNLIVGVPEHDLIPYVENKVKVYDIKVAIHNHGPQDKRYPTVKSAYEKIKSLDPRLGLCLDIGHIERGEIDPSIDTQEFFDRIFDFHIKDIDQANENGKDCEIGRGVIDFQKFLNTVSQLNYTGLLSLEYEKDENDPLPGMAESFGYVRGVLATLKK